MVVLVQSLVQVRFRVHPMNQPEHSQSRQKEDSPLVNQSHRHC